MKKDQRLEELVDLLPKNPDKETLQKHIERAYEFGYSEGVVYGKTKGIDLAVSHMERQFGIK